MHDDAAAGVPAQGSARPYARRRPPHLLAQHPSGIYDVWCRLNVELCCLVVGGVRELGDDVFCSSK